MSIKLSSTISLNPVSLASINFITAHDGFTLNDLVSYNYKHNEENGENNRDGSDDNLSYNHGFEGECVNPKIETLRLKKIKNFLEYLFKNDETFSELIISINKMNECYKKFYKNKKYYL